MVGVSLVICCYNSSDRISKTLDHISAQTGINFPWEVILVDNCSKDGTKEVALQTWVNLGWVTRLEIIDEPNPGLSNARMAGVRAAQFEIIVFCDDDNWLMQNYVANAFKIFEENPQVGVVGGQNIAIGEGQLPNWFFNFQEYFAVGCQQLNSGDVGARNFVFGAGMAFRQSIFNNLRNAGFVPLLKDRTGASLTSGGDVEICYLFRIIGLGIYYDERLILLHYMTSARLTKEYLLKLMQAARESFTQLQVYDPYLRQIHHSKRAPILFFYYLARYFAALVMQRDSRYFLTYVEATNFLPVTFMRASANIKRVIKKYQTLL